MNNPTGFGQGGFAPQQNQGGFGQAQAPGDDDTVSDGFQEYTPPAGTLGFARSPEVKGLRIGDYLGHIVVLRMHRIEKQTWANNEVKDALIADIVLINPTTAEIEGVHEQESILNKYIIGMGNRLLHRGQNITCGVLAHGEKKGGYQPPLIVKALEDESQIDFCENVAVEQGWWTKQ